MLLAGLFVSCGKKKNGEHGAAETYSNPVVDAVKNRINAVQFQAVTYDRDYQFSSCSNGSQAGAWQTFNIPNSTNNCQTGIRSISTNGLVKHSQGRTEAEVKAYLLGLLNNIESVKEHTAKACFIEFRTKAGEVFIIDLTHPLITNPVHKRADNGLNFYIYNGYTRPISDNDCNRIQYSSAQGNNGQNTQTNQEFEFFFPN